MTPLDALEKIAIFRALSTEGLKLLSSGTTLYHFTGGETVIHQGQDVSGAYFVMSGGLRVFTLSAGGKESPLYQIAPGETCIIALNSLFNDLSYPAWVESERDTLVAVVPGRVYRTLFAQEPCIQDITLRALSTLVFRLMGELEDTRSQSVAQRLAGYLLANGNAEGRVTRTQQDIAARIGTTREVIARIMVDFSARGLVETGRGWSRVLDSDRLTEESGPEPERLATLARNRH